MKQVTRPCPTCRGFAGSLTSVRCTRCESSGGITRWEPTWSDRLGEAAGTVLILAAAGIALTAGTLLWLFAAFGG